MRDSGTGAGPVRVRVCALVVHDGLIRRQREA